MKSNKRVFLILFLGLAIGLALGSAIFFFPGNSPDFWTSTGEGVGLQSGAPRVGQPAPEFSAKLLDGLPIDEQIFIGNHTVLNFWATWCAPCQQEMPVLQAVSQDHPTELQVIGMNVGESLQQITPFLESYGINFDIAMDNDGSVQRNYAVLGLPITFFIDPEGTIIAQHVGGVTETQMLGYLEKLGVGSD